MYNTSSSINNNSNEHDYVMIMPLVVTMMMSAMLTKKLPEVSRSGDIFSEIKKLKHFISFACLLSFLPPLGQSSSNQNIAVILSDNNILKNIT